MQEGGFSRNFWRLLTYLRPYSFTVLAATVCSLLVTVAKLAQARFVGWIFTLMEGKNPLQDPHALKDMQAEQLLASPEGRALLAHYLNVVCLSFLAAIITLGVFTYLMRYLINQAGQQAMRDMRNQVFSHVQRLPLPFFDQMRMGEIQSRASGDVVAATGIFTQLSDVLINLLIVVLALGYMLYCNPKMTLGVLALSPLIGVAIGQFGKRIGRLTETIQARGADLSAITYEGISSVKGIKAYGLENLQVRRFSDKSHEAYRVGMKMVSITASQSPIVDFLGAIGIMAIVWLGFHAILDSYRSGSAPMDLGTIAEYWTLLVMTTQPINALSGFYSNFQASAAAAGRVFELLDHPTEGQLTDHLPDLPPIRGEVTFENVIFGYTPEKLALRGLNLAVREGEVVAIVGSNGAGKSTLIQLLARFYDPQEGVVRIDGHDLKQFNLHSLRDQIGLVTQESILLGGTIAENIAMGREGASQAEVEAAARVANAHEFITRMPDGYQTDIGERGSRLSGGQRQRVAIARALLRNPRILVLDEFTSGIDPESELLITEAIEKSLQGRTCFVIAHRFNTIRHADRIIVLDEGGIVEAGNHDQLMSQDGLYRRIYLAQLKPKESEALSAAS